MSKHLITLLAAGILTACGGGSDGGSSGKNSSLKKNAAEVTSNNHESLAQTATYGAIQTKNVSSVPLARFGGLDGPFNPKSDNQSTHFVTMARTSGSYVSEQQGSKTINATIDLSETCEGGVAKLTTTDVESGNGVIQYIGCNVNGSSVTGKVITKTSTDKSTISIEFKDFSVTQDGEVTSIDNFKIACKDSQSDNQVCTVTSDFKAVNGLSYRIENPSASGSDGSGYKLSAKVYDTSNGSIFISSDNLAFACENGFPSSGSLTYGNETKTAKIIFNSCNEYSITFDGVTNLYSWSSGKIGSGGQ